MIKLIVSDMDGTLLDENSKLPYNFFDTLEKLEKYNINFVVASGRSYSTLYQNFEPYSDRISYICDNGSYIVDKNKNEDISVIDENYVKEIINVCENIPDIAIVLCGTKGAYRKECNSEFTQEIDKYYIKHYIVDNLLEVKDDIFKIAICDMAGSEKNSYKVLNPKFGEALSVVVSAALWVDINNKGISKGYALEKLQKKLNVSYNETMAFGDFYNDVSMLQKAYYSFVMENANEPMKQYGNFIAKSNKENGVIKAIEKYIFEAD